MASGTAAAMSIADSNGIRLAAASGTVAAGATAGGGSKGSWRRRGQRSRGILVFG